MTDHFRDVPIMVRHGVGSTDGGFDWWRVAELRCWRLRVFFHPEREGVASLCVVCKRPPEEHQIGPCSVRRSQFLAHGRCKCCGEYTMRDHRT